MAVDMRTDEQIRHDRINLPRLMKRLEQAIQDDDLSNTTPPKRETWVKAQAMLQVSPDVVASSNNRRSRAHPMDAQQIRHARLLLSNVELDSVDPTPCVPYHP